MSSDHQLLMRLAIVEGEQARGGTGDNPWVGCIIVDAAGEVLSTGHTQRPGEDHAEIGALRGLRARGLSAAGTTLYSTLEPCSFHGRTPACAKVIVDHRVGRVVLGMRDPHPRVDGLGARLLLEAGVEVIEGVCEAEVRRQLGEWIFMAHSHEPRRRARDLASAMHHEALLQHLSEVYAVSRRRVQELIASSVP